MRDMVKILKMLASLMKFGRLATKFPPAELEHFGENALNVVKSWNRPFEDIDGLLKPSFHLVVSCCWHDKWLM
jgi:hypothetical protein